MLTIESTATVDESHRLTLAVPASVPPGAHRVTVVIRDCQPPGSPASRGPMRAVPDFVAQQRAAGMKMFTKEEAEAFDRWLAGESE